MWIILCTREPVAELGGRFACYSPIFENYSEVGYLREENWKENCVKKH